MTDTSAPIIHTTAAAARLRVAHLSERRDNLAIYRPDEATRAAIAQALDITSIPEAELAVRIVPAAAQAWHLSGELRAQVVQPCVVTLDPVQTSLSEAVTRHYSPHAMPRTVDQPGEEFEMGDETLEPLGQTIDLDALLQEELLLALPQFPRAAGAALDTPDTAQDEDTRRPFAGLAALLDGEPPAKD